MFALARFGNEIEPAITLMDRSLQLNPSFARGWYISGWLRLWAGQADLASAHFQMSLRLNPRDQSTTLALGIGVGQFINRRFADAVATLSVALEQFPNFASIHRWLAASYAHMGRLDEARDILERLRIITPVVMPQMSYWRNPEDRELLLAGLRLAIGEAT